MFKNYIQINSSLKWGKTMILVSGHFHYFRGPPCWIYRPSRATCFVVFKKIWKRFWFKNKRNWGPRVRFTFMYHLSKEKEKKIQLKSPKLVKKFGYQSRNGLNAAIFSTQKCGKSWGLRLSKSSRMGGHRGIDHVIKMQYMYSSL